MASWGGSDLHSKTTTWLLHHWLNLEYAMGSSCTKEQLECYTVQCQDNIITQRLPLRFDLIRIMTYRNVCLTQSWGEKVLSMIVRSSWDAWMPDNQPPTWSDWTTFNRGYTLKWLRVSISQSRGVIHVALGTYNNHISWQFSCYLDFLLPCLYRLDVLV